jgi:hypothetical protein
VGHRRRAAHGDAAGGGEDRDVGAGQAAAAAPASGITRAVAPAVAIPAGVQQRGLQEHQVPVAVHHATLAGDPAGPDGPQEVHVELQGRLELVGFQGGQQRRPDGVVQHRRLEGAQHVAGRVGERLGGRERQLDRAGGGVGVDELQSQGRRRARQRRPPVDRIPERSGSSAHGSSFSQAGPDGPATTKARKKPRPRLERN